MKNTSDAARDFGLLLSFPETAVLNIKQVAQWLQVSVRAVERMDIPSVFLGTRTKRYLGKDVLAYLEKRKAA